MHAPLKRSPVETDPRSLVQILSAYRQPNGVRSTYEIGVTLLPFAALWVLTYLTLAAGYIAGILLTIPAGLFLLRLFLVQHDCGHDAFFQGRAANKWVGRLLGVLTLTPFDSWRRAHAIHHAGTGNLDSRGVGDVDTLTVAEFRSRSPMKRLLYRLYRSPIVLFGIGPAYIFLLRHRFPLGPTQGKLRPWLSAFGTNAAIAVTAGLLIWAIGLKLFLLVHIPIALVAASLGVWFFYVQHQFEETMWDRDEDWTFHHAALHGSSHYALPGVLRWFTANVGVHHVHHLASRIPFYRLGEVLRDMPSLAATSRVTVRESLGLVKLVLWDEEKRRLVSFREARG